VASSVGLILVISVLALGLLAVLVVLLRTVRSDVPPLSTVTHPLVFSRSGS
ncbi:MAG: hypothetical protein QOF79_500, partial [Actinomycetota bacterium]|nr:hypothetical protein [Actinomycetota bacterium]